MRKAKYLIFFVVLLCIPTTFGQQIEKDNPTYQNIDYDNLSSFIDWEIAPIRSIRFLEGKISDSVHAINLKFKKSFTNEHIANELFQLDTLNHSERWFSFYANPIYFDSLQRLDLTSLRKGKYYLGKITDKISRSNKSLNELAKILLETGVLNSYSHLNAEMVHQVKEKTKESYILKYNAVWHFCTNDCFHPKYKFELVFDKSKNRIWVIKL